MHIFKSYFLVLMAALLTGVMTACSDDSMQDDFSGDTVIKAFYPSAVMAGSEVTITGTGLNKVTSVVFPGNVTVNDFTIVSTNSIKVVAPRGVQEGPLAVVADGVTVESRQTMRPAVPSIRSMVPGDEARELQEITIKGEDLECIEQVVFPSAVEGEEIVVNAMSFARKGTSHLTFKVPVGIRDGIGELRLVAVDGSTLTTNPITLIAAAPEPDGSVVANIIHIGSGRYLTRNAAEDYPRVMDFNGSKSQEFSFVPVDGMEHTYYIKNNGTNEFLIIGDENNWRMIWVIDPTTISVPEKGMYQIIEFPGSENIQIKNLGSGHLGTDSNDDNSEVYGDKWGETEPRFLWKLDIISGSFDDVPGGGGATPGESSVLWEGSVEFGEWNVLEITADLLAGLHDGDTIRMYFTPEADQYAQMDLRDQDDRSFPGFEWLGLGGYAADGYVDFLVDQGVVDRLQAGGLLIRGSYYTITKVEIIAGAGAPVYGGSVLYEGEFEFGEWKVLIIKAAQLAELKEGDAIRMHFYPEPDQWPQMDLRDQDDRSFPGFEWLGLADFVEDGYVDFVVDQGIVDRLQAGGLLIRGSHYIITKVEII